MRALGLIVALAASVAGAGEVELRLPPSSRWEERADPNPPPSSTAKTRWFVRKDDPDITLRLITDTSLHLDYSEPVLRQLGRQLTASQQKPGGTPLRISEPKVFTVEGAAVGSIQILDPDHVSTLFYFPSENGDRVLTAQSPREKQIDLPELMQVVETARGLRKPDNLSITGPRLMGAMAGLALTVIVVLLWTMREKKPA